jgi:hypothetical protein
MNFHLLKFSGYLLWSQRCRLIYAHNFNSVQLRCNNFYWKFQLFMLRKIIKTSCMNDRDVLFFAPGSKNAANFNIFFLTVHRCQHLHWKILPIYPCKKYLLGTDGLTGSWDGSAKIALFGQCGQECAGETERTPRQCEEACLADTYCNSWDAQLRVCSSNRSTKNVQVKIVCINSQLRLYS